MGHMLCAESFKLDDRDTWWDKVNTIYSPEYFALCTTVITTDNRSPGQLVFNQDLTTQLKYMTDWQKISDRLRISQKSNAHENRSRITHKYRITDQVLVTKSANERCGPNGESEIRIEGPYHIIEVHKNGTVNIRRGAMIENISIGESNLIKRKHPLKYSASEITHVEINRP